MTSHPPGVLMMLSTLATGGVEKHAASLANRLDPNRFIASCDVMVLSSHVIETFSIAALEAMSLGKPEEHVTDGARDAGVNA